MRAALLLACLFALAACTPAERCRLAATRDARSLDRQIGDSERNIARGYELIAVPVTFGGTFCFRGRPYHNDCALRRGPDYIERPINVAAERAKLASLRAQRAAVEERTQAALALCPKP